MVIGLAWTGAAAAQPDDARRQAMTHYQQAEANMKAAAYEAAATEYLAAFDAVPKPALLFNAGLAYEKADMKKQALEQYQRYLALAPQGRSSTEARARVESLKPDVEAAEAAAAEEARRQAEEDRRRLVAESHAGLARTHAANHEYDKAIEALRAAYEADPNPAYVFQLAEVYRAQGDRARAITEYDLYQRLAPEGESIADAVRRAAQLRREIEEQPKPLPPTPPPPVAPPPAKPPADAVEEEDEGVNWWWIGAGAAAMAAGLIIDLAPDTARDGELSGTDFIPLPFYAAGITFVAIGVF